MSLRQNMSPYVCLTRLQGLASLCYAPTANQVMALPSLSPINLLRSSWNPAPPGLAVALAVLASGLVPVQHTQ